MSETLQPFDDHRFGTCPKCDYLAPIGSFGWQVVHVPEKGAPYAEFAGPEHLRWACEHCGYVERTETADAAKRGEA